ncbi:MAG: hypothetical protein LUI87_06045 [Lachnospiraceae bacterium]|nr:hypothetical protein [Lachnospiraceae bacterium]
MKLCYADGAANKILLWVGLLLSVCGVVLVWLQYRNVGIESVLSKIPFN